MDVGDEEGECVDGPYDGVCSYQPFRHCDTAADCNPPPAGTCGQCAAGQTCVSRAQPCFTDDGVVGNAVSVTGAADAPCTATAKPTVGALFCLPPVGVGFVDVQGLPGLGRARLPGTLRFSP